jgi:hypothetical protein
VAKNGRPGAAGNRAYGRSTRLSRLEESELVRKRTYTVREVADLTGLSPKAVSRRIERGSLRSVLRRGRRLIPATELVRAGLIPAEGERQGAALAASPLLNPRSSPSGTPSPAASESMLASLFAELLDRLERQANELAQFRALTAEAESLRMDRELSELRSRLAALEVEPPQAPAAPRARVETRPPRPSAESALEGLWLPPAVPRPVSPHQRLAVPPRAAPGGEAKAAPGSVRSPLWRVPVLLLEAAFIAAVAVIAWLAELPAPFVVASVGAAWLIAATTEGLRWRRRSRS